MMRENQGATTLTEKNTPNYGRRIIWLAVFVAVLFGGYSAGWYYLADRVVTRTKATIAQANRDGVTVECENPVARGFPFRLGIYCDRVAYADADRAVGMTAGNLRTAGQIYDPTRFIAELDGPATLATPGAGPLRVDWQKLRASVRWAQPLPERISMEGGDLTASTEAGEPLAAIGAFEAHMRPNGQDLDLASNFRGLTIDPALAEGRTLPAFSGRYDLTIRDGVELAGLQPQDLRGHSGTIRDATLSVGGDSASEGSGEEADLEEEGSGLSVSGTFSVAENGLLDANLKLTVRDPQALSAVLVKAFPEKRREIRNVSSALSFMGNDPTLPLVIERGEVKIAFFKLGRIPPF